jgi:hypothetical protein
VFGSHAEFICTRAPALVTPKNDVGRVLRRVPHRFSASDVRCAASRSRMGGLAAAGGRLDARDSERAAGGRTERSRAGVDRRDVLLRLLVAASEAAVRDGHCHVRPLLR